MELFNNASLAAYTTFGVEAFADRLYRIEDMEELRLALQHLDHPLILGGGSNILTVGDIHRDILRIELKGIEVIREGDTSLIRIAAGEVWHDVVLWALEADLGGIENLSLIPGTTGAAPIQNIGAYGVELDMVFHSLEAMRADSGTTRVFTREQCRFGYRDSIFKNELRHQYVITNVTLQLSREHTLHTTYGAIQDMLTAWSVEHPTIRDVSRAVINIRQSKLPDPTVMGNAGSFFKNPILSREKYEQLFKDHPDMPGYPAAGDLVKVPAGWLIEQAGWKGVSRGRAGCYEKQALVLVNLGGATGQEVWSLAREIMASVQQRFAIDLIPEVNVWGT